MLGVPGASVPGVTFEPEGIVVRLRLRARHPVCPCGRKRRSAPIATASSHHRGYGHHSAAALIAMIYLCCGRTSIVLPFK